MQRKAIRLISISRARDTGGLIDGLVFLRTTDGVSKMDEIVGTIVLSVNGKEHDCSGFTVKHAGGWKQVPSMNSEGRTRLKTRTSRSISLSIEVFVNAPDTTKWVGMSDGVLTIEAYEGQNRTTYTGVTVTDVSSTYGEGSEAKRTLEAFALEEVEE